MATYEQDIEWAELVYQTMPQPFSFGFWKRETESIINRQLEPTEATSLWDMITGRAS